MTLSAPFPYFGGKRRAAPRIWQALGDPSGEAHAAKGGAWWDYAQTCVGAEQVLPLTLETEA